MTKRVKIMVIGHPNDRFVLLEAYAGRTVRDESNPIDFGRIVIDQKKSVSVNGEDVEVEFVEFSMMPGGNYVPSQKEIEGVNVVLYAMPGPEFLGELQNKAAAFTALVKGLFQQRDGQQLFWVTVAKNNDQAYNEVLIRLGFPRSSYQHVSKVNKQDLHHIISNAIQSECYSSITRVSRIAGSIAGAVLGLLTGFIVNNPIATTYGAISECVDNYTNDWKQMAKNLGWLLIAPFWGTLKGTFYDGVYQSAKQGWQNGFIASLRSAFIDVPHKATYFNTRGGSPLSPRVSKRDIIASLIVAGLIAIAIVGVLFPAAFGIATLLPTVWATLHMSGLSTAVLALIAAATTFVGASLIYGIIAISYDKIKYWKPAARPIKEDKEPLLKAEQQSEKAAPVEQKEQGKWLINRIAGAIAGAIVGTLTALVIHNPVASFYSAYRRNFSRNSIFSVIPAAIAFFWNPLKQAAIYFENEFLLGYEYGFFNVFFGTREKNAAGEYTKRISSAWFNVYAISRDPQKAGYVSGRDFVASWVVIGLITAAVLAVVLPPASAFIGIPALAATLGLGSLATPLLAVIAGVTTFVAASIVYGIGSNVVDYMIAKRAVSAAESLDSKAALPTGSSVAARPELQARSTPAVTAEPVVDLHATRGLNFWQRHAPTFLGGVPANDPRLTSTLTLRK